MSPPDEHYTRRNSIRLNGFDYSVKRANFITIVTHGRKKSFNDQRVAESTVATLLELRGELKFNLYSYCLMPDHIHLLIGPGESGLTIGRICGHFKSLSTRLFWKSGTGKLWQRQFFDHVIRNEADFWECVDYIRLNPIVAGLISVSKDWEFFGEPDLKNL